MPRASVLRKSLRDAQWQIAGFGLTLAVIAALDVFIWPAYRDALQNFEIPPALQAFIGSELNIATAAGFLSAEFFSWIPILLIVYAVIQGTGAIAGEESSGTLDLLLAQPIRRRDMVLQKVIAAVVGAVVIVAIGYVGFVVSIPFVDIAVSLRAVGVSCANMLPITLFFYALSLWAGAAAPNRATSVAGVIGVATAGYFVNTVANGVEALHGLRYATPFYYYGAGRSLIDGIIWWHTGLLLGAAAALVLLTLGTFGRRDVSTGGATDYDVFAPLRRRSAA